MSSAREPRDAYGSVAAVGAVALLCILAFSSVAPSARAFWPFSAISADAATPLVHDPSIELLEAASNRDPNPSKAAPQVALSDGAALVPNTGPSGTLADVSSTTPSDRISVYVVREGDTLSDIAKLFAVSPNTIVWANNLGSARDVHPGQTLIILPVSGVEHTVTKGETLASIARRYRGDANEIVEFNGLNPEASLAVGSSLIIPGGELAAQTVVAHTARWHPDPYRGGSGPELDGYFTNPLPGSVLTQSIHGWNAVDLGAPRGTPILAAAPGAVIIAQTGGWHGGYGSYVVITHSNGTETLYAHMSRVLAVPGENVSARQVIGYVGMTGHATGPHLHFEVRGARNPFAFCPFGAVCEPR